MLSGPCILKNEAALEVLRAWGVPHTVRDAAAIAIINASSWIEVDDISKIVATWRDALGTLEALEMDWENGTLFS